jgi:hypothetical protein
MKVFKVITNAAGTYDNYADGSDVEVSDGGIATVKTPEGDIIIFSPIGWLRVEVKERE